MTSIFPKISLVVPVYNESKNIGPLHKELVSTLRGLGVSFEIIFVDDGSLDGTDIELKKLFPAKLILLEKNVGQTGAFAAGIREAKGEWLVTIDGDQENDPKDIPQLLLKAQEGFDVISGGRKNRWSSQMFTRRLPSTMANKLISWVTKVNLHDHGCSLKVYRRSLLNDLHFHGDLHRMLAAYIVRTRGAKIAELPVNYRPRQFGESKYGLSRTFKVILDIITFYF